MTAQNESEISAKSATTSDSGFFAYLRRRPLQVDILTTFSGLLIITVLAIILYAYHENAKAVLNISEDLIQKVERIVIRRTSDFLEPAADMAELIARRASKFGFDLPGNPALEALAISIMHAYPQLRMINMADNKGNFLMPKRMPDGTVATKMIDRSGDVPFVTWKYRDTRGEVLATHRSNEVKYDHRSRPWYKKAVETKTTRWTDAYIFFTDRVLGITASHPVKDGQGRVTGAVAVDIELGELSAFLSTIKIGESGIAFIIDRERKTVAFPEPASMIVGGEESSRMAGIEELGRVWITRFFEEHDRRGSAEFVYKAGGTEYIGMLADFPDALAIDWKIVIIVPQDDFVGPLKTTQVVTALLSLAVLLLAIGFSVFLSRSISRPILRLAKETERIKAFQLEGETDIQSHIKEIQVMNEAVKGMRASLVSFTRYAPEEIVRQVVAEGREALLEGDKREVTVLFSDLRGFTRYSEKTRPETVVAILNTHFDEMVRLVSRYGGYVIDFLGDSVFAVFGAPTPDPDHARHALTCAVDMQLARLRMNRENADPGIPAMEMGVGLNTGYCVVGNMGSNMRIKYGAVGHTVNLGARIESFTVGGQVLISQSTFDAAADFVTATGPFKAFGKGVADVMRMWEVRGLKDDPDRVLPPVVSGLKMLPEPVPVTFRRFRGKQVDPETCEARLIKLSPTGAEMETDRGLAVFANIQAQLPGSGEEVVSIDGKIVNLGERENRYILRFTGIGEAAGEAIRRMLAGC
ncbi:MAG: Cache 3/Cache 2 fusion domain-containing protein [Deltaproteobacteria bacterium]|nr:Cache 3/Cache 2 fusion domain-containing protein [Deltaproteobacteria bacterium]